MKRNIFIIAAFVTLTNFGKAQLSAESLIGNHAGSLNWERLAGTLEIKDNYVYELKSYNLQMETESTTKGRWRIEGDQVILTDLLGVEIVLHIYKTEFYITAPKGGSCMARFYQNKSLAEFLIERSRAGC